MCILTMLHPNRDRRTPHWCSFVGTISLLALTLPVYTIEKSTLHTSNSLGTKYNGNQSQLVHYRDLFSLPQNVCSIEDESQRAELHQNIKRPKCTAGVGCDIPLHCHNYTTINATLGSPQVIAVTPVELQGIVENQNVSNNCVMVMFYAPWCEHCVQFARRYNTIGRMFTELPTLSVDLSVNDPHKYVLAYLPVVAFYYHARVVYRFKLTETMEELQDMIVKMTDFPPLDVSTEDTESDGPVPVIRTREEKPYLYFSIAWIVFVVLVFTVRTSTVSNCLEKLWGIRTV